MMPYCAIDIETTGLDPERCQVLEIACVVETDWSCPVEELPTFRALCEPDEIRGEPFALALNARLLAELAAGETPVADLAGHLIDLSGFIAKHMGAKSVTIAGKNFGAFDYAFLRRCPQWDLVRHKHRFIDVGNLWWEPETDACLPDMPDCLRRAGLSNENPHRAVDDCRAVVKLVRKAYAMGRLGAAKGVAA